MCTRPFHPTLVVVLAALLALLLFLLDTALPQTLHWGGYLLPIVLVFLWGRRRDIYLVTALTSVLIVAAYWTEGPAGRDDLLLDHLLPLIILWGVAWLMAKRRQLQEELDVQVETRTAALAAREEQLAKLFDANPGGIAITRQSDGRYLEVNDAYLALVGYSRADLIGRTAVELGIVPPEERDRLAAPVREHGPIRDADLVLHTKSGATVTVLLSSEPLDFDGETWILSSLVDITDRKHLEEALAASERKYRDLYDNSPDMYVVGQPRQGLILDCNQTLARTLGYTRNDLIGQPAGILFAPASRARLQAESKSFLAIGSGEPFDMQLQCNDGKLLDVLMTGTLDFDSSGSPSLARITFQDVTARHQAEAALRDSEERFRLLVENSPDVIALFDELGRMVYVSPSFEPMHGASAERALAVDPLLLEAIVTPPGDGTANGRRTNELANIRAHPQFANRTLAAAAVAFCLEHPGEQQRLEVASTLPSGDVKHFHITYVAYQNARGRRRVVSITRDVTELKRAENALAASVVRLREANQRLRLAADAAGIGVWTWNFADGSLEWDERMCELYAVPPDQRSTGLYYELWRARVHPDDRDLAEPSGGDPIQSRSPWSTTFRIVLPGGDIRHIQVNAVKQFAEDGQPLRMIGVNRDVTNQQQYELLLRDTNAVLEQRVAARTADLRLALADLQRANCLKDEFMSMISHELRTPITGVLSLSELLADEIGGPLNARQALYVKGITESGERLLAVINGILSYTHLLSGKVQLAAERWEVAHLLAVCATSQQYKSVAKGQTISMGVDPPDLAITADATALGEVVKRLLDNAIKFTPDGGCIGLDAHPGTAPNTVDLVVWDTGIGISADQVGSILKPFTQADARLARSHEGTGLGLAYVDEMVRLMGGTIAVASTPGEGSRFTITLPA
ncbi:MAG: PAS domain S-box protein [Caldilineaceae bacterium]